MHFAYDQQAWLLGFAAALALFAAVALWRRYRALRRLADAEATRPLLLARRWVVPFKTLLLVASATLLGIALLGPQWGYVPSEAPPARGRDLLILLDVSRSMLAEDVAPNRLARARADVRDLVASLEEAGGYRVGLIAFADRAALLCPLTTDYRCFEEELARASLETLRLRGDVGLEGGTQIAAALLRAGQAIDKQNAPYTDVLLISDGGDMAHETLAAADDLRKAGIVVHALGLGDRSQGALIPVVGADGRRTFLRYQGELVRVRLEEPILQAVAQKTGGRYLAAGTGYLPLDRAFREMVADKESRELAASVTPPVGIHRYQAFLALALALLLLETMLGNGRRTVSGVPRRPRYFGWVRRRQQAATTPAGA
jgi:Ca-activated chloride channel family protein